MELSDKEWEVIEPLFPTLPSGIRGRPWRNNREVLEGILWILRTGAPWRDLPPEYPPYQTSHRRLRRNKHRFKVERFFSWIEDIVV